MIGKITISAESPFSADAIRLMNELSACLKSITGDSGRNSFKPEDVCVDRALFVVARDQNGEAVGCGAFRPMNETVAEVKRMYAAVNCVGLGSKILTYLETQAYAMGYQTFRLETRIVNKRAVAFYEHNGYNRIPNYGKYIGRPDAVCFEKNFV